LNNVKIPLSEHKNIVDLYTNGIPVVKIAVTYDVSHQTIYTLLSKYNIELNNTSENIHITNKKYKFNENYFEVIDSQEKAYWLGFIFADGNVSLRHSNGGNIKSAQFRLTLKKEDESHLDKFIVAIDGDMKLKDKTVRLDNKEYESSQLDIYNTKFCNDLIKLGCVPNKSLILEPPNNIPEEYYNSFIRGYFDGDGCIGYYPEIKKNKLFFSILGTETFVNWIKEILDKYEFKALKIYKTNSKAFALRIIRYKDYLEFYKYIYNNSNCELDRKKNIFTNAMIGMKFI